VANHRAARGDFVVRRTRSGLGLVAARPFRRGEFVVEYTGKLLPDAEADRRGGRYLFRINSRWTVDGSGRGNVSRYINHSCAPNCVVRISGLKIRIYTLRRICAGEELTYDYGKEYFEAYIRPRGCRCARCAPRRPA
jgi:SET domain-containing protein